MRIFIDNRTQLSNEDVGIIIDDLQEREKNQLNIMENGKDMKLKQKQRKYILKQWL